MAISRPAPRPTSSRCTAWRSPEPRTSGGFVPQITELQVALPALRALLGEAAHGATKTVKLSERLLTEGPSTAVVLDLVENLDIDFRKQADACGGLVAPKVVADVISSFDGPVAAAGLVAAGGRLDPLAVLDAGASLLGFDLRQLIAHSTRRRASSTPWSPGSHRP